MKQNFHKATNFLSVSTATIISLAVFALVSCQKERQQDLQQAPVSSSTAKEDPQALKDFTQVNLVGNNDEYHPRRIDPNFINGWGISFPPSGPAWVSAEGAHVSFLFDSTGAQPRIPVNIPGAGINNPIGHPTGQVFNPGNTGFK